MPISLQKWEIRAVTESGKSPFNYSFMYLFIWNEDWSIYSPSWTGNILITKSSLFFFYFKRLSIMEEWNKKSGSMLIW